MNRPHKVALAQLKERFANSHKMLWESGRRDPVTAFDEFSKLLFAKVYDEVQGKGEFRRQNGETAHDTAVRVLEVYDQACNAYPGVFNKPLAVSEQIVSNVVEQLQDLSLVESDLDSPGRAFEAFLGDVFKAELGQYLTPRPIVQLAITILNPGPDDVLADPACGSGGFLLYGLNYVSQRNPDLNVAQYASQHLVGVELNERLAHLAMVTMVLHGDGHSNVFCANALSAWPTLTAVSRLTPASCDVVATNPPFGGIVSEPETLEQFDLGSRGSIRRAQKSELLFLERCIELLKAGGRPGRLALVLPDSVLTTVSLQYVRQFIQDRCHVLAVISLPSHTFAPAGIGVKASLVVLQRRQPHDDSMGMTFMALPSHVGYDATGRVDEDSLPVVATLFSASAQGLPASNEAEPICYMADEGRLTLRMDPFFHKPSFSISIDVRLGQSKYPVRTLGEIVESISGGATPAAKGEAYVNAEAGVPLLRIQNIQEGMIDLADVLYIDRRTHTGTLARSMLTPGDVLLTITGRIGTAAVVPPELREANINQHIVRLRVRPDQALPGYLEAALNSALCRTQMERIATGSTRPALDYSSLRSIRVPIPPLGTQSGLVQRIADLRNHVRELEQQAQDTCCQIQALVEDVVLEDG